MRNLLNKVKKYSRDKRPCVVYCKPGSDVVTGIFQKDAVIYPADFSSEGFVFAPFSQGHTAFIPFGGSDIYSAKTEIVAEDASKTQIPNIDSESKTHFEELVAKSIAAIKTGEFDKLVCSRTESVPVKVDISEVFAKMAAFYPNAFRYCFYHPETGLWMGATPEQLLKSEGDEIHTVALAGTQVYEEGAEAIWQDKEKQEQQFVTDYIVTELEGVVENIHASTPYTFRAGNIIHIKTDIKAKIKKREDVVSVIKKLHPTPAVCGLPTDKARQFLLQNEGYNREYYSGFLGELNRDFSIYGQGKTDLFVNLRCMKIEKEHAHLFIGCGITGDSDPEKEFIETVNKSLTMRRVL